MSQPSFGVGPSRTQAVSSGQAGGLLQTTMQGATRPHSDSSSNTTKLHHPFDQTARQLCITGKG